MCNYIDNKIPQDLLEETYNITSVSYTHLDVYKRQSLRFTLIFIF